MTSRKYYSVARRKLAHAIIALLLQFAGLLFAFAYLPKGTITLAMVILAALCVTIFYIVPLVESFLHYFRLGNSEARHEAAKAIR